MFGTTFDSKGDNFQSYYKDVSMKLKNKELDMLIVVNMFLTGFDATTLNTLWVDKWLQMHGLIQAFSRTNRILNSIKKFGNIVSFRPLEKRLNEAIALFSDQNASGLILIKSFNDYYNGYTNQSGIFEPGYKQLVHNLLTKFPSDKNIISESEQKEFIKTFGRILQVRNILIAFDEFKNKEIFSDFDLQNYLGLYQDLYQSLKEKAQVEKKDITNDLVFEMELIKQIDINIDHVFGLVKDLSHKNTEHKELVSTITKMIESSFELRSKKELILDFLNSLYSKTEDLINEIDDLSKSFNEFKKMRMTQELNEIIEQLNLNEKETNQYINDCFKIGELKTFGIDIEKVLPKVSRFSLDKENNHQKIKLRTINALQKYFDKFFNI